jgi:hypothetical protein
MVGETEISVEKLRLVAGAGDGVNTACLMSARALLDGRGLVDSHPSLVIRTVGVRINDAKWWKSDEERTRVLMPVALDPRLCATSVDAAIRAEVARAYRCADKACRVWLPRFLDAAGLPDRAERLRTFDQIVDARTARLASLAAGSVMGEVTEAWAAPEMRSAPHFWCARQAARSARDAASAAAALLSANAKSEALLWVVWAARAALDVAEGAPEIRGEAIALLLELCEVRATAA